MQEETLINKPIEPRNVPGWGLDADLKNDPTYPIKTHTAGEHDGYSWDRPEQQEADVEVLHSNERPNLAAAFGTTLPPSGISGVIRRQAFKHSEDAYMHWLPLMVADRVQMVEGLASDLARGHIPNIFKELGWDAEWKYNRKGLLTKIGVGAAVGIGLFALIASTRRSRSEN